MNTDEMTVAHRMRELSTEEENLSNEEFTGSEFAVVKPQSVLRRPQSGGTPKPVSAPEQLLNECRELVQEDPTVAEAIDKLTEYVIGTGDYAVYGRNVPYTDSELTLENVKEVKALVESSNFYTILFRFVRQAFIDGVSFMEINWQDELTFEPRLLPAENMKIQFDKFGQVAGYVYEDAENNEVEYGKYDVAHLGFWRWPDDDWYYPLVHRILDQSKMLSHMEVDMARFVATKAYPPILWKLGTGDKPWPDSHVRKWRQQLENLEPDSMMVARGDIETETVGVGDTTTQSGVMDLTPTFGHLEKRISTGLGIPSVILNGDSPGQSDMLAQMPSFDRRVKRFRRQVLDVIEHQVLFSLQYHPDPEGAQGELSPTFEFGVHSSEEERLDTEKALSMFNNLLLTPKAFARWTGLDYERDIPDHWKTMDQLKLLERLKGAGDNIQNPDGGRPSGTQGGTRSAEGAVTTRDAGTRESDGNQRPGQSVEENDPAGVDS